MKSLNEEALDILVNYYYPRAKYLQLNCNWGELDYRHPEVVKHVNDDLMTYIDIYDCYSRNAAGFSNVLQDLKFGSKTPKWRWQDQERRNLNALNDDLHWDLKTWLYVFMCHRITGSGASFESDHGYRNNAIQHWGRLRDIKDMADDLVEKKAKGIPLFTSIGNQPPAPKKGVSNVDFMVNELPDLLYSFCNWLTKGNRDHKSIVDFFNDYNKRVGHRKFNFVYAAFSMDCSDYYPEYVDKDSHTYLGNNALRCMKRLSEGWKPDEFMDVLQKKTGGRPKDLEDVMCDFVRFGQNYVPRGNGTFDHIPSTIKNNSGWDSGWEQRQGAPLVLNRNLDKFFEDKK
jgi:hypothetical protein